jgi:hypothetical protein
VGAGSNPAALGLLFTWTRGTRLIPEIGKIEAKKTNWIEVKQTEAVFLKLLWSPGIDSKELILPAYALAGQSPYF